MPHVHIGIPFILSGVLLYLIAVVWILILAFQKSFWWVLGCLLVPPVALVFLLLYWPATKTPLLLKLSAYALIIGGVLAVRFVQ